MKLIHHLDPYVIRKLNKLRGSSLQPKPQPTEPAAKRKPGSFHLSERDIKELMGTKRDRYHRVNGKVKRK